MDQLAAQELGRETQFSTLELGIESNAMVRPIESSSMSILQRCGTPSGASQMAETQNARELPAVDQSLGVPGSYAEHARLMMDLLALVYQTDLTSRQHVHAGPVR